MNELQFTESEKKALRAFWEIYEEHRGEISARLSAEAVNIPAFSSELKSLSADELAQQEQTVRELQRLALVEGNWQAYQNNLRDRGTRYANMGISFSLWFRWLAAIREIIIRYATEGFAGDGPRLAEILEGLGVYLDVIRMEIAEAYLEAEHKTVIQQQLAIRELSTPVLQLRDKLLLLPLVGVIDTQRARQLTEGLLYAIRDRRAKAVVMDITGVPVVDSKVANHLVLSVEAARLMGATVILTGMSPEIAQTLVTLGSDLPNILTVSDLQGGIEEAMRILSPAPQRQ